MMTIGEGKKPMPKWIKYYDKVAYAVLVIDWLYSIAYLSYVGSVMNDRKMYLPYRSSRTWLELNSYSLLPPFFALPVAPMLVWQVRDRVELSDGDFYGIVGTMLGLGAVSVFDAYKTMYIYMNKISDADVDGIRDAMQLGVIGEIYTDYVYNLTIENRKNQPVFLIYEHLIDGYRVQKGDRYIFLDKAFNGTLPTGGTWTDPVIADRGIRFWTHSVQQDLECCGSNNYTDWDEFKGEIYQDDDEEGTHIKRHKFGPYPPSCYCKYSCSKDLHNFEECFKGCGHSNTTKNKRTIEGRPGCHNVYMDMLRTVYLNTFILMLIMGILYMVTILTFVINFAAVRLSRQQSAEDDNLFPLLRSTSDESFRARMALRRSNKYLSEKEKKDHQENNVFVRQSRKPSIIKTSHSNKLELETAVDVGSVSKLKVATATNKVTPLDEEEESKKVKSPGGESPKPVVIPEKTLRGPVMVKVKSNKGSINLSTPQRAQDKDKTLGAHAASNPPTQHSTAGNKAKQRRGSDSNNSSGRKSVGSAPALTNPSPH